MRLLVQGCSNKEIASHLNISPRPVKQRLRTLFLRARIKEGRNRVTRSSGNGSLSGWEGSSTTSELRIVVQETESDFTLAARS